MPPPPVVPPLRFALVEEESPAPDLLEWCERHNIQHHAEVVKVFKDEVNLTRERVAELLELLVAPKHQPVYVHCLDGRTVTGTLIMCLRKLQRWQMDPISDEFSRSSRTGSDVPRRPASHVIQFVEAFKPELDFAHLLPNRLPMWLALALKLPTATEDQVLQ